MAKGHKGSNEQEFQGQVGHWLNDYVGKHPSLARAGLRPDSVFASAH
jgi:hypothetical protein